jgi:hypothetical protein
MNEAPVGDHRGLVAPGDESPVVPDGSVGNVDHPPTPPVCYR